MVDARVVTENRDNFKLLQTASVRDLSGAEIIVSVYQMKSAQFGDKEVKDLIVISYSLEAIQAKIPTLRIILGFNAIRQFNWFIDRKNQKWSAEAFR